MKNIWFFIRRRAILSGSTLMVLLALGAWLWFANGNGTAGSLLVKPDVLLREVAISGKVVPAAKVNLSFKTGGRITRVAVKAGQAVNRGQTLVVLENGDESRAAQEAELDLASARLARERLASALTQELEGNKLKQAYEDGLAEAAKIYADLFTTLDELDQILFGKNFAVLDRQNIEYYRDILADGDSKFESLPSRLRADFVRVDRAYAPAFAAYQAAERGGSAAAVEQAILATAEIVKNTLNLVKTGLDVVQAFEDKSLTEHWRSNQPELVASHLNDLTDYQQALNEHWLNLVAVTNTIRTQQSAVTVSDLDLRDQELTISRRASILARARAELAATYLTVPFAGVVADVAVELGERVAAETPVVVLISTSKFEIESYVPEINVAAIKLGDPATVTLDAYGDEVLFAATVTALDPAETIRDGVATYKATLQFTELDPRIRSGMTANVIITAERRANVLLVPLEAVFERDGQTFVKVVTTDGVTERPVKTGSRSSFGQIEIVSGLRSGEYVLQS